MIDSHIHLWRRADGDDVWVADKIGGLARDFTVHDWKRQADAAGVAGAILVQAAHSIAETERALALAAAEPRIVGVVGWADLFSESLADDVARFKASPHLVGIRPLPPGTFGADWLTDARTRRGLATLGRAGVSVDVLVKWPGLARARDLLSGLPEVRVVLNHCGRPDTMTGQLEPWASDLKSFARATTATIKLSGLIERAGIEWTAESLRPYIATVIDAFGPSRVMFATNWPVLEIGGTYGGWVAVLRETLAALGLSEAERHDVFAGTACRAYGVSVPAPR
ncbi:MAG: amidohydrolase family protein [Burkholderiales bacterium]|nr:amidohydrolase family protein [Burkholderiales bacterium]